LDLKGGGKWDWRKFHGEKLHVMYSSPDIIIAIRSRSLRWAGRVGHMGQMRNKYRFLVEKGWRK
jgi:hypothetical protein